MTLGRKTGGGSRLGKPNKHPKAFKDRIWAYCAAKGVDPFEFMIDMIVNAKTVCIGLDDQNKRVLVPEVSMALKFQAAREIACYLEPKQKMVTLAGDSDSPIEFTYNLKIALSDAFARAYGAPANQQNGQAMALPPVVPVGPIRRP